MLDESLRRSGERDDSNYTQFYSSYGDPSQPKPLLLGSLAVTGAGKWAHTSMFASQSGDGAAL
jgi:hypothetical protein